MMIRRERQERRKRCSLTLAVLEDELLADVEYIVPGAAIRTAPASTGLMSHRGNDNMAE
jgi:hypothetical protein